jgi:hypothetical protein
VDHALAGGVSVVMSGRPFGSVGEHGWRVTGRAGVCSVSGPQPGTPLNHGSHIMRARTEHPAPTIDPVERVDSAKPADPVEPVGSAEPVVAEARAGEPGGAEPRAGEAEPGTAETEPDKTEVAAGEAEPGARYSSRGRPGPGLCPRRALFRQAKQTAPVDVRRSRWGTTRSVLVAGACRCYPAPGVARPTGGRRCSAVP